MPTTHNYLSVAGFKLAKNRLQFHAPNWGFNVKFSSQMKANIRQLYLDFSIEGARYNSHFLIRFDLLNIPRYVLGQRQTASRARYRHTALSLLIFSPIIGVLGHTYMHLGPIVSDLKKCNKNGQGRVMPQIFCSPSPSYQRF